MIKNYITIAWRSLLKNRLFSFINIFGLALSMSVCMMVLLRIVDNFKYDTFHPHPEKTFRILSGITQKNGNKTDLATTPLPLKEVLSSDTSIFKEIIHLYPSLRDEINEPSGGFPISGAFTDPAFLRIFGFTLKHGDINTALDQPFSIILTEHTSTKFFGDTNPVGKVLELTKLGTFKITGVLRTPPDKSHIQWEAYASISSVTALEKNGRLPSRTAEWDTFEEAYTYALLKDGVSEHVLSAKLAQIAHELNRTSDNATISLEAQPIDAITPGWHQLYHETSRGNSWGKLLAEVGIAMIILVSACFNYTNLSIARALTRGKEVGIRKISGAARWQIFAQYITESVVMALFALLIAQSLLAFILEYKPFNSGYEMVPDTSMNLTVLLVFLIFALFAGLLAGALPAAILSSFRPVKVLRSMWSENVLGSLSLRKSLMVFQFALSLIILIFLTAFYRQFEFMGSADPGFERRNIIVIPYAGNHERFHSALLAVSGVEEVGHTSDHFGKNPTGSMKLYTSESLREHQRVSYFDADARLINMMNLDIAEGENFPETGESEEFILINEKTVASFGLKSSADAVGRRYFLEDSSTVTIRGVVKDFYHRSVGHTIEPLVFRSRPTAFREALVRVSPMAQEGIEHRLLSAWRSVYPDHPMVASWLDEKITEMNNPSADVSLLAFLAFITVTIATMGLLGLVVYTVETKRKEISIRKIVGASVAQIMLLLSKGYTKLLLIAGLIALPVGYTLSNFFLMAFANKVSFGAGALAFSFGLLLMIGLTTILSQTFRAASENPARNLRSE